MVDGLILVLFMIEGKSVTDYLERGPAWWRITIPLLSSLPELGTLSIELGPSESPFSLVVSCNPTWSPQVSSLTNPPNRVLLVYAE